MSTEYMNDVKLAAMSGEGFDRVNSIEIGNLHGEEPKHVLRDIQETRKLIKGDK